MRNQLKRSIQKAFITTQPDAQKKNQFLKNLPQSRISMHQFIFVQAFYIRKISWFMSGLILMIALFSAYHISQNTLWVVSAFVPTLGLLAVTESNRSIMYGMNELEMSTRFSLKSIILARMSLLGIADFSMLAILAPLCCIGNDFSLLQTGMYLLVPYLLTVNISLWIARHSNDRDILYGCMCVATIVSGINTGLHLVTDIIYQELYTSVWLVLTIFLIMELAYEIYCTIKQTEETTWNLSLMD